MPKYDYPPKDIVSVLQKQIEDLQQQVTRTQPSLTGSGGGFSLIEEFITVGGETTFDFTGLSGDFPRLVIQYLLRTNNAQPQSMTLVINGDVSASAYQWMSRKNDGANSSTTTASQGDTSIGGIFVGASNPAAGNAIGGEIIIDMPFRTDLALRNAVRWFAAGKDGSGGVNGDLKFVEGMGLRNTIEAINQLTLTAAGGSTFIAGGRCALYGVG